MSLVSSCSILLLFPILTNLHLVTLLIITHVAPAAPLAVGCVCVCVCVCAGDSLTRRGIFDSILAGCIPVLLLMFADTHTLPQYSWHLTPADMHDIAVVINVTDSSPIPRPSGSGRGGGGGGGEYSGVNYFAHLQSISEEVVRFKQRRMADVALRLQYSLDPPRTPRSSSSRSSSSPINGSTWKPPFKDAVEIIIDAMFNRVNALTTA